jgi:YesN/AraC family two-component response regulator
LASKKKVALTAFWAGNLVVHDERFILEKLEDEVKIYWSLIDYQGMANALMKRLDRSDIRDFSAMRKNKKLIEDYLRLLMTICLSRLDEVCELMLNIRNQETNFHYKDILQVLEDVEQLLLLICEDAAKQKQDGVGISWKVRRIIDINYPSPINLSMLSSILVYSPSYIDRSFRKIFGMSVNQYLIQTRLNAAKSLLWSTNNKVRDISESVGYNDYFNFAKQFRKQFGLTPTEYRAQRERNKT